MLNVKLLSSVTTALFLASCATTKPAFDIGRHNQPILAGSEEKQADLNLLATLEARQMQGNLPEVETGNTYGLAELIDIAQRRNPATRQSWLQMKNAGNEANIVKSALLPMIAATVIAGGQGFSNTINQPILGPLRINDSAHGAAGILTVNWLLFDFGENDARQQVANSLQKISSFTFNRVHQQLVFDVAFAFHARSAGLQKQGYAKQAILRAEQLVFAAERRFDEGVGTNVEVAQARQLLAQTKLTERVADGEAISAAVSLASSLGLPPSTQISLQDDTGNLPRIKGHGMEAVIDSAFSERPDILAALTQVRAAQYNIDATAASYRPKVFLGANLAVGNAGLDFNGFSVNNIGSTRGHGVLVGITVPIYDGNLRRHKMKIARDQLSLARSDVGVAKSIASREIAFAYQGLLTALAVHQAAGEVVNAAKVTADAAQDAYTGGIGTISDVSLATLGLYTAEEVLVDSRRAVHQAAATLALATGH